jgi:hypothetical protein
MLSHYEDPPQGLPPNDLHPALGPGQGTALPMRVQQYLDVLGQLRPWTSVSYQTCDVIDEGIQLLHETTPENTVLDATVAIHAKLRDTICAVMFHQGMAHWLFSELKGTVRRFNAECMRLQRAHKRPWLFNPIGDDQIQRASEVMAADAKNAPPAFARMALKRNADQIDLTTTVPPRANLIPPAANLQRPSDVATPTLPTQAAQDGAAMRKQLGDQRAALRLALLGLKDVAATLQSFNHFFRTHGLSMNSDDLALVAKANERIRGS